MNGYHARVTTTRGEGGVINCRTTARSANGDVLFARLLVFRFAGMFGSVYVEPTHPTEFDWYLQIGPEHTTRRAR